MKLSVRHFAGLLWALAMGSSGFLPSEATAQDTPSSPDAENTAEELDALAEDFVIIDGVAIPLDILLEGLDDIEPEAAGVTEAIWLEMPIPVCWESMAPEHAEGRAWTQDAVENSWAKVANISFEGWTGCEPFSDGIRINVTENGPHVAQLGKGLAGLPDGMILNFSFESWGVGCAAHREYCIRALAVHEFGHAIGLAHEHNRDDRQVCAAEMQGPLPTFTVTAYDPSSVMNYCASDWNNSGRLSTLDVAGARMIYGPFTDETPATGHIEIMMDFLDGEGVTQSFQQSKELTVSASTPSEPHVFWQCNNTDRLLKIELLTSIAPGRAAIDVVMDATLFGSTECETGGPVIGNWSRDFSLAEPFNDEGRAVSAGYGGFYDIYSFDSSDGHSGDTQIRVLAYRSIGKETASRNCQDCVAASAEAVFASDKIKPASGVSVLPD